MNWSYLIIVCSAAIISVIQAASLKKLTVDEEKHDQLDNDDTAEYGKQSEWSKRTHAGKPKTFSLPFYILPSGDRNRGFAALGFGGLSGRALPYNMGKRTAGIPYYSLPSDQRNGALSSLGIGSAGYPGKRAVSTKRVASFLPSYVISSETSRNQGLGPLGIGSAMFRSGRNKPATRSNEEELLAADDDKLLSNMADILSELKSKVDDEEHKRLLKQLNDVVEEYTERE